MSGTATAKVWNDWDQDYEEEFRGDMIRIKAKSFITMPWPDAVMFRGQYTPIIRDGLGRDLRPKMIRLEKVDAAAPEFETSKKFICQVDGKEFDTQEELDSYIAAHHTESMVDDEAKKKLKAKHTAK